MVQKTEKGKPAASEAITFEGELSKITTTVDGGWNITFSVGQDQAEKILPLSEYRDTSLQFAVVPITQT